MSTPPPLPSPSSSSDNMSDSPVDTICTTSTYSPPMINSEKCQVCYMIAFGYNYNVVTCNACKMFFRRVMVDKLSYDCKADKRCFENAGQEPVRPKCRACRFQKCLEVGMKYILPGKQLITNTVQVENLAQMIGPLLYLDSRRRHKVINMYTDDDPTLFDILCRKAKGIAPFKQITTEIVTIHEWSFFGIYTSIEFFLSLEFMEELDLSDKYILLSNFGMKASLLGSAIRVLSEKRDKLHTPDGRDVYPDQLMGVFPKDFLDRIRSLLVVKLKDLRITDEEYVLITVILFCNPVLENLSLHAQTVIASQQRKYSNLLMKYCLNTYQQNGPTRYNDILSVSYAVFKNFEDVQHLTFMFQFYVPAFKYKRLFGDIFPKS